MVARRRRVGLMWAAYAFGGASLLLFVTDVLPPAAALLCLIVALVFRLCDWLRVGVPRSSSGRGSLSEIHQATSDAMSMVALVELVVAILALGIWLLVLVATR